MPFQVSRDEIEVWFQTYGYWVAFLALTTENILFTSLFVPGLLVLIIGGFYAGSGHLSFPLLLLVSVAGMWIGDATNYILGRFFWSKLARHSRRATQMLDFVHPILNRRGRVFFIIYHFEPICRMVGAAAAGTSKVAVRRWMPYDFLGAVLWVLFYGTVGFSLGHLNRSVDDWTQFRLVPVFATLFIVIWFAVIGRTAKRFLQSDDSPSSQ